jgi:hypothetical protein
MFSIPLKVDTLNIPRIIVFAVVLLVLRVVVSAVMAGAPASEELGTQDAVRYLVGYLLDATIVIAVFARLARIQVQSSYIHAFFVVILQELLGVALLLVIGGANPSSPLWWADWLVLVVSVLLGTEIGRRLRASTEKGG